MKIVSATDASVRATISGDPDAAVTALALGPDDRYLFTASHSRLIRVWDVSSLQCIRSWKVNHLVCNCRGLIFLKLVSNSSWKRLKGNLGRLWDERVIILTGVSLLV